MNLNPEVDVRGGGGRMGECNTYRPNCGHNLDFFYKNTHLLFTFSE